MDVLTVRRLKMKEGDNEKIQSQLKVIWNVKIRIIFIPLGKRETGSL